MEHLIQQLEQLNDDTKETNDLIDYDTNVKSTTSTEVEEDDGMISDDVNEKYLHLYRISLAVIEKNKEHEEKIKNLEQKLVDKTKELEMSMLKNKEYEERVKYLVDTIISKSKEETAENFTMKTALIENNRALLRYNNELLDTKSQLESFISKNKSESEERWTENNRVLLETNMVLQNVNKILREDKVDVLQRTYPINIDFDDASKEWNNDITNRKTKVVIEKEESESQVTDGEDESKEPDEIDKNREHGEGDKHQKNESHVDSPPMKSCKKLSDFKVLARRGGQPRKQNHYPKRKRTLPIRFIDQREERQWGKDTIKRVKVSERVTHELVII